MPGTQRVTSEERIFSLLLALASSQLGVTKTEILRTVHGYAQKFEDESKRKNLERQFERDKDALRQLGIPIETFEAPGESGNNQQTRYRIPLESLTLSPDIDFNERELTLLRLASFAWRESTLSGDARSATLKLSALGNELDTELFGVAPTIRTNEASFEPLRQAAEALSVVEFRYRKPAEASSQLRNVAPLSLERIDGRWHLVSWDFEREATRIFLLSRIQGPVAQTDRQFDPNLFAHVEPAVAELKAIRESQVAKIVRRPGSEAETRLSETLHYIDEDALAEDLVAFGSDVFVAEPDSLRERVIDLFKRVEHLHRPSAEAECA